MSEPEHAFDLSQVDAPDHWTDLDKLLKANNPSYTPPTPAQKHRAFGDQDEAARGRAVSMANHPNTRKKLERQKQWIEQHRAGGTVQQCCDAVGISRRTYDNWRTDDDTWFRDKVEQVRRETLERDYAAEGRYDGEYDGTFESFRAVFMGMGTYKHQRELVDILDDARPMSVTLVTFPPEHGKTTTVEDFICWKLGEDPDFRFGVVSEGQQHGRKIIQRVKHRMTDPGFAKYQGKFGPFKPESDQDNPWTADYITVAKRNTDERDYSLVATGINTSVSGSRYDELIVDDVQSKKSLSLSEDFLDKLRQDHFSRVGRRGPIVFIATRVGEQDIYQLLLDKGVIDRHIKFPAVRAKADPMCGVCGGKGLVGDPEFDPDMPKDVVARGGWTCNCRVLCPEMWDGRSLDLRRKQVGEEIWWTTYQQAPQAATRATFTKEMIDRCERDDLHVGAVALDSDRYPRRVLLGLDPALDGGNALVALACNQHNAIVTDLQVDFGLAQWERIMAGIEDFAGKYAPHEVVIEKMAFQKGLVNDQRVTEMAENHGFRVIGHETRSNKTDPNIGVASMDRSFMRRELLIPNGDASTRSVYDDLRSQLLAWKPNVATKLITQDAVMALWFVWKRWMETRRSLAGPDGPPTSSARRAGVPYRPAPGRIGDMAVVSTAGGNR